MEVNKKPMRGDLTVTFPSLLTKGLAQAFLIEIKYSGRPHEKYWEIETTGQKETMGHRYRDFHNALGNRDNCVEAMGCFGINFQHNKAGRPTAMQTSLYEYKTTGSKIVGRVESIFSIKHDAEFEQATVDAYTTVMYNIAHKYNPMCTQKEFVAVLLSNEHVTHCWGGRHYKSIYFHPNWPRQESVQSSREFFESEEREIAAKTEFVHNMSRM
jgi:hypothetical protein